VFQLQRPFFSRLLRVAGLAGALAVLGAARPALADGPVGLIAGGAFPQGGATFGQPVGQTQWNLGASYDVGPKFGPFRGSLSFDYANGPTDGQSLNDYGFSLGVRLTTPLYAGLTFGVYNASTQPNCASAAPGGIANAGGSNPCPSLNTTGFGSTYFVGVRLVSLPGFALSLQGGYRQIPVVGGFNPSGPNVGLRLQL
jgi:hypothetical protein